MIPKLTLFDDLNLCFYFSALLGEEPSPEELNEIYLALDSNSDGEVSFQEFIEFMAERTQTKVTKKK